MNTDQDLCDQCIQWTPAPARFFCDGPLSVEWSTKETDNQNGCVGITFCSWDCAARWFRCQAVGRK